MQHLCKRRGMGPECQPMWLSVRQRVVENMSLGAGLTAFMQKCIYRRDGQRDLRCMLCIFPRRGLHSMRHLMF